MRVLNYLCNYSCDKFARNHYSKRSQIFMQVLKPIHTWQLRSDMKDSGKLQLKKDSGKQNTVLFLKKNSTRRPAWASQQQLRVSRTREISVSCILRPTAFPFFFVLYSKAQATPALPLRPSRFSPFSLPPRRLCSPSQIGSPAAPGSPPPWASSPTGYPSDSILLCFSVPRSIGIGQIDLCSARLYFLLFLRFFPP